MVYARCHLLLLSLDAIFVVDSDVDVDVDVDGDGGSGGGVAVVVVVLRFIVCGHCQKRKMSIREIQTMKNDTNKLH